LASDIQLAQERGSCREPSCTSRAYMQRLRPAPAQGPSSAHLSIQTVGSMRRAYRAAACSQGWPAPADGAASRAIIIQRAAAARCGGSSSIQATPVSGASGGLKGSGLRWRRRGETVAASQSAGGCHQAPTRQLRGTRAPGAKQAAVRVPGHTLPPPPPPPHAFGRACISTQRGAAGGHLPAPAASRASQAPIAHRLLAASSVAPLSIDRGSAAHLSPVSSVEEPPAGAGAESPAGCHPRPAHPQPQPTRAGMLMFVTATW
jgi:hypothetical protein